MSRGFARFLAARQVAVIGGGAWCAAIVGAARRIGFSGRIVPVHPSGAEVAGLASVRAPEDIEGPIDAAFVGVNRDATIDLVARLRALGAGGAVCFASGFSEAVAEDMSGAVRQAALIAAAAEMPILGPNCYGFVNALDRVALWPDQHGMEPCDSGVAILTQSSNIAINLTQQCRNLPIGFMVTCGNMAQTSQATIAQALVRDPRVTAIGLHVEGFGDLRGWEILTQMAAARDLPLVVLKTGASQAARLATLSHTGSLAGSDAGARALLDRLGIARVDDLGAFLETLKLLHFAGPLGGHRVGSISCSGGEAGLVADTGARLGLEFPPLDETQAAGLRAALGPKVALANPLDYHTYIWRDADAMGRAWTTLATGPQDITVSVVDYPRTDAADWGCATQAAIAARQGSGKPFAVVASLPELMPDDAATDLIAGGVVPLQGLGDALTAVRAARRRLPNPEPLLLAPGAVPGRMLDEAEAKARLSEFGLAVPKGVSGASAELLQTAQGLCPPLAAKALGLAHKSEHDAVRLGLAWDDLPIALADLPGERALIEEMASGAVAELLVGVVSDPAHGFVLTLGAGGVLTELWRDNVSMLLPVTRAQVAASLDRLRIAPLLHGYRGKPGADLPSVLDAVMAVQAYVVANADTTAEVEINPLICSGNRAIAVDALIRETQA